MKNILKLIPVAFLVISCNSKVSPEELNKINGYWEVTLVETPDGEEKEYGMSTAVDYIELKDNSGFRQKVVPQIDGKYFTNDVKELITVKDSASATYLVYKTDYANWTEELVKVSDEVLVVKNDQDFIYHYKRFEPIKIE